MRSMELVGRERMEVAVSINVALLLYKVTDEATSNNSQSGAKLVTMMFRMSRISLVFSSTKSASSKTKWWTATINTVSLSRVFAILRPQSSPAETVSKVEINTLNIY